MNCSASSVFGLVAKNELIGIERFAQNELVVVRTFHSNSEHFLFWIWWTLGIIVFEIVNLYKSEAAK